jgi:phage FluMu protein Com
LLVYGTAMGTIVRCATCDGALIQIARGGGRAWLDLRGPRCLEIQESS